MAKISVCERCGDKPHTQDEIYEKGKRVFNRAPGQQDAHPNRYRCTVCLSEKEIK